MTAAVFEDYGPGLPMGHGFSARGLAALYTLLLQLQMSHLVK